MINMFKYRTLFKNIFYIPVRFRSKTKNYQNQILQKTFNLSYTESYKLLKRYPVLQTIEPLKLTSLVDQLLVFGFTKEEIITYPSILALRKRTLLHQYHLLEELGFKNISIEIVLNYIAVVRKNVWLLKVHGHIAEEVNVAERLRNYCDVTPKDLYIDDLTDKDSLKLIITTILQRYLEHDFSISKDHFQKLVTVYPKTLNRSFRLLRQNIKQAREIGFADDRILRHWYIASIDPENTKNIIETFPRLIETDIRTLLLKCPKLLEIEPTQIKQILDILESFDIPESMMKRFPSILTLSPHTIEERLRHINSMPEFKVLAHHPRILLLVLFQNKAKSRMLYLRKLRQSNVTMHLLCTNESSFEKFITEGYRTSGCDTIKLISNELKIDTEGLRQIFQNQTHWNEVPMTRIATTLAFLREKEKCTNEDLIEVPHVLFYPRERLIDAFKEMSKERLLENKYMSNPQRLRLALYFMEKPYHFTGNGVWLDEEQKIRDEREIEMAALD